MAGPARASLTRLYHLVLPALALGIVSSALILRFTRASMLDVLSDDYVRTARSKGMGEFRVVMKHAFKNALIPILTVLGLTAALLVSRRGGDRDGVRPARRRQPRGLGRAAARLSRHPGRAARGGRRST